MKALGACCFVQGAHVKSMHSSISRLHAWVQLKCNAHGQSGVRLNEVGWCYRSIKDTTSSVPRQVYPHNVAVYSRRVLVFCSYCRIAVVLTRKVLGTKNFQTSTASGTFTLVCWSHDWGSRDAFRASLRPVEMLEDDTLLYQYALKYSECSGLESRSC